MDTEIGPIIQKQWKPLEKKGGEGKEVMEEEFKAWWPTFIDMLEAKQRENEEAEAKIEEEKVAQAAAKASMFDGDGVWNIPLTALNDSIDAAYKKNKTPLIIDNIEGFRAETFFTYSDALIIEMKKLIVEKAKGKSVEELLEEVRDTFVNKAHSFKYGKTVVLRMANSACDVKGTFSNEAFPTMELLDAAKVKSVFACEEGCGEKFKGSPFGKMFKDKEEDKSEIEIMGVNEKLRIVVVTQFQEEDYAGFLEPMFPLNLCQPIKPSVN